MDAINGDKLRGHLETMVLSTLEQGEAHGLEILHRVLVADGVHAIAQRHVLEEEPLGRPEAGSEGHAATPCQVCASRSPVRSAAEVMMSRLPA